VTDKTILRLTGIGIPPYSARGLTQTLRPIEGAGQVRRTINGTLVDFSGTQFRKYASNISASGGGIMDPPAIDSVWPGLVLTVECICELAYDAGTGGPERPAVSGSEREADGFSFYRPVLEMMVVSWNVSKDEYGAVVSWAMDLEEV
jgi:hypothetical protein